jgi:hypothetical protein
MLRTDAEDTGDGELFISHLKKGSAAIIAALLVWQWRHWPFALCAFPHIFLL